MLPNSEQLWRAHRRISGQLPPSPLLPSESLTARLERPVYLKVESAQPGGSFKVRGALNRLAHAHRPDRVITSSSGNHAAALAMVGQSLGTTVTVVVPEGTPEEKIQRAQARGAEVRVHGAIYDASEAFAREMATDLGIPFISAFEDTHMIAGAGTIIPEILDHIGSPGTMLVPVGGGGLISGIARALEVLSPDTRVVGVQPKASCPLALSFRAQAMVEATHRPTLSEGTAGGISGTLFAYLRERLDEVVTLDEPGIADEITRLLLVEKVVAEGAGALASGALNREDERATHWPSPIVAIVSGGNIDRRVLGRVLSATESHTP